MLELNKLYLMDCMEGMRQMSDNSIDSIVTDPPYGINFMGKKWDYDVPSVEIWKECLRVLRPGGYLLSFAGTRTQHRMTCNIEDVGFEIRDMIAWVYGSGFPKSLDVSKAIDKMKGVSREVVGQSKMGAGASPQKLENHTTGDTGIGILDGSGQTFDLTIPATQEAQQWDGWGTALKPAMEPITVARKPLSEKTVAENVLKWGTGGINIDGCRIELEGIEYHKTEGKSGLGNNVYGNFKNEPLKISEIPRYDNKGRFPANLVHDGSGEVIELFPESKSGAMKKPYMYTNTGTSMGKPTGKTKQIHDASSGSAARFFYCAKASRKERGDNNHPTVKPITLMRYLVKLVTHSNGIVLDPFCGSGTTLLACILEGMNFIGFENDKNSFDIATKRIDIHKQQGRFNFQSAE